jgi:uncharacterized protein
MEREVFLDTACAIALSAQADQFHRLALAIADRLEGEHTHIITSRAVLIEIGNSLSKVRYRVAAVELLDSLENDPNVTIMPVSDRIYSEARELFRNRMDKDWGLTDCISFVVMRERQLTEALTSDIHFQQAGIRALLREMTEP